MFRLKLIQVAKVANEVAKPKHKFQTKLHTGSKSSKSSNIFWVLKKKKKKKEESFPPAHETILVISRQVRISPHSVCRVPCAVKSDEKSQKFHDRETLKCRPKPYNLKYW